MDLSNTLHINIDPRKAESGGRRANTALNQVKRGATNTTSAIQRLGKAFAYLGGAYAIGRFAKSVINARETTEGFALRLNILLGSVDQGALLFKKMTDFASNVPFEYQHIMASATQLAGVMDGGVKEIEKWMPMISDLAAVSGLGIEQTTTQIVRMYAAGAASADLFRERGITAMLGFKAGVAYSAKETQKQLIAAFESPVSKFRGASEKLKTTFTGLVSIMGDAWFQLLNKIADTGVYDKVKSAIRGITEAIKILDSNLDSILGNLGQAATAFIVLRIASTKMIQSLITLATVSTVATTGIVGLGGSIVRTTVATRVLTGAMTLLKRAIPFAAVFAALEVGMWAYSRATKEAKSETDLLGDSIDILERRRRELITTTNDYTIALDSVSTALEALRLKKGLKINLELIAGKEQALEDIKIIEGYISDTAAILANKFKTDPLSFGFIGDDAIEKVKKDLTDLQALLKGAGENYQTLIKMKAKLRETLNLPAEPEPEKEHDRAYKNLIRGIERSETAQISDEFERRRVIAKKHQTDKLKILRENESYNKQTAERITAIYKNELAIIAGNEREHNEELAEKRLNDATDWQSGYKRAMNNLTKETTDFASISENAVTNFADGFADAFVRMAETGKLSFKGLAASIISDLLRIHAKAVATGFLRKIISLFADGGTDAIGTGGDYTGFGSSGNPQPGVRYAATGGNVRSNIPVVVGEQGREIFTPNQSGRIIPNHALPQSNTQARQSPNIEMNISIDASGSEAVDVRIQQAAETTFKRAVAEVMERAESGGHESIALGIR